ncbi:MAG TPA: methylmalonyl Co-A mutase-associated GTPase MeaB [Bryobacteraceae bacterium]|nr:methylmalonyl Co-A mutase-associated GTPase MeaB [Bryobacteraceae bacterium]
MTRREIARLSTAVENGSPLPAGLPEGGGLIVGVTGPPGAGKSSLVDALTVEWRKRGKTVGIIAVDPSSRVTGGAILGDRIRMQRHHSDPGVFVRSMASRGATGGLARATDALARLFLAARFDFVVVETVGAGQDEIAIAAVADVTVVVLTPNMGDDVQAIKAGVMEIADIFAINKADLPGVDRARREIEAMLSLGSRSVPVFQTIASENTGVAELADAIAWSVRRAKIKAEHFEIDHLGIAVQSIDDALRFYVEDLGMPLASRETVEHEKVHVAMLPAGESRIELLEPSDHESTVARFIEKRGPGLHHVAMKVADLNATIARLERAGVRILNAPKRGAGGHLYVFVHPASTGGVLWELIQK